ncbi:MAG: PTS sugar transporter subunit IIB [Deltaproteobacteria bacterium]|nr:PTS sugar transporter subunit IIB [Deltaproteobacteria bacterium]MBN2671166.1 PTS sugar transporter subunit IIB [Deltaproteobacteria bacterium]
MDCAHKFVRIDNRLLHGQVVQFWIPYLKVEHLVIADDIAASTPAMISVYRMAVPKRIRLSVVKISMLQSLLNEQQGTEKTLVVLGDVFDFARALMSGFECRCITLGNVHSAPGRERVTDAVFLSKEELAALTEYSQQGRLVEIQTFPGDVLKLRYSDDKGVSWFRS